MSTNLHLSTVGVDAALDAVLDVLNGGTIKIYTGTQPADCDTAVSTQTLLATLALSATAFSSAASGSKTANAVSSAVAAATGTATWFRAFKSDGTTAVIDGDVGTSSADLVLATTSITKYDTVAVSSWSVSFAK